MEAAKVAAAKAKAIEAAKAVEAAKTAEAAKAKAAEAAKAPVVAKVAKGKTMNPKIRDIVKGFSYMTWNSNGQLRSGKILRRNPKSVSVEPFDAEPGHYCTVGYGLIYDVEPSAPKLPTANDNLKNGLEAFTFVSFRGKSGEIIEAKIIRRNDKTLSVLPVDETDPQKYWRVPYSMVTPISAPSTVTSSTVNTSASNRVPDPDEKFTVMVSSDGEWDDHDKACDHASAETRLNLGSNHNGSAGGYFTNGITVTYKEILANPILAKAFRSTNKEVNLWPKEKVGCFVGIIEGPGEDDEDNDE